MGYDYKSIQENEELFSTAYIATIQALLGIIPQNLRAMGIGYTGFDVYHVAIYDKKPTYDDIEDVSAALTEVSTHTDTKNSKYEAEDQYLTVPYPDDIGPYVPNWGLVYLRKEPVE